MDLLVVPLHNHPEFKSRCCTLINSEWSRSETARMRSIENSSDSLPVNLILLQNQNLIGHLKLTKIPSLKTACFVESVVIDKHLRGFGFGSYLMNECEKYCREKLGLKSIFLSTKGQELFYEKLGYRKCEPVSIYGNATFKKQELNIIINTNVGPPPPPLPNYNFNRNEHKTFMCKNITDL